MSVVSGRKEEGEGSLAVQVASTLSTIPPLSFTYESPLRVWPEEWNEKGERGGGGGEGGRGEKESNFTGKEDAMEN